MENSRPKPKYQGGTIITMSGSEVGDHYHMDYFIGDPTSNKPVYSQKFGWGYIIDVTGDGFEVTGGPMAEDDEKIKFSSKSLTEAVKFCFDSYKREHPGKIIAPCWGAAAPNGALEELGYAHEALPVS